MSDDLREKELKKQGAEKAKAGAEEYAEKIYDEDAPTPPEFADEHAVSNTGSELKEEK